MKFLYYQVKPWHPSFLGLHFFHNDQTTDWFWNVSET